MTASRKRFTQEFKDELCREVISTSKPIKDAATAYGVGPEGGVAHVFQSDAFLALHELADARVAEEVCDSIIGRLNIRRGDRRRLRGRAGRRRGWRR